MIVGPWPREYEGVESSIERERVDATSEWGASEFRTELMHDLTGVSSGRDEIDTVQVKSVESQEF